MRHFDAWLLRDPYSIFHYYSTGHRWKETVRDLIQDRKICAPLALSQSLQNNSNNEIQCSKATQQPPECLLLTKLPPEIRLLIYEYVFGDEVIHLVTVRDKICHVRCKHPSSSLDKNRRCCPVTMARWRAEHPPSSSSSSPSYNKGSEMLYPHTNPSLPTSLSTSTPSLLLTCRKIYTEASPTLYKTPTFDVDDLATFIAFSFSIAPAHLACITSLTVQWTPFWTPLAGEVHKSSVLAHTHNDGLWSAFWERVGMLRGLRVLGVSFDLGCFVGLPTPPHPLLPHPHEDQDGGGGGGTRVIGGTRLPLSISEPWVEPLLCNIRGLESFELGVTARCDEVARRVLLEGLVRDAGLLRDQLRVVLCSSREDGLLMDRRCAGEDGDAVGMRARRRLAIMAA